MRSRTLPPPPAAIPSRLRPKHDRGNASGRFGVLGRRPGLIDGCRSRQSLRIMYDVLLGIGDCGAEETGRSLVRELQSRGRLRHILRPPAGVPRLRVRMADSTRSFPRVQAGSGRRDFRWRMRIATNTARFARPISQWLGAGRWFSPISWPRQNPGAWWSPRPASCRGGFSPLVNGVRPYNRGAFCIVLHKNSAAF